MSPTQLGSGRLAAVWVADIVDFTALAGRDQAASMRQLDEFQTIVRQAVTAGGGVLVGFRGDGALAEFTSADAAMRAASATIDEFASRSGQARIGINIGEVVGTEAGDLHGDGVTVATRLQEDAAPGEILVGEDVHRQLRNRREFYFEPAGERLLRGMDEPVRTFSGRLRRVGDPDSGTFAGRIGAFLRSRRTKVMVSVTGIYLAAVWTLVEIAAFIEGRYQLTPNVTDVVLASLLLLFPSVLLVTYYHADPGKQKIPLPEKVGIPANLIAASIIVVLMFGAEDIGAVMQTVEVVDADGVSVERQVPKSQYRKRLVIYPFETGPGEDDDWLQYGMAFALQVKLSQDIFFDAQVPTDFSARLKRTPFPDGIGMPVALQREIAQERHLRYFVSGHVAPNGGSVLARVRLHDSRTGRVIKEFEGGGRDIFSVTDAVSDWIKTTLGIPQWHLDSFVDLPTAEVATSSTEAFRAYTDGAIAVALKNDFAAGAAALRTATEIDGTFALANLTLGSVHMLANEMEDGKRAIAATMEHLYRLPERLQFLARHNHLFLQNEMERARSVLEMGAELYPEDIFLLKLNAQLKLQSDQREEAVGLLERIIKLDPEQHQFIHVLAIVNESLGREQEARGHYEAFIKRFPENYDGYLKFGDFLARIGSHAEAAAAVKKAASLEADNVDIIVRLATIERNLGNFDAAWSHLDEGLRIATTPEERVTVRGARRQLLGFRGRYIDALAEMRPELEALAEFQPPVAVLIATLSSAGNYVRADDAETANQLLDQTAAQLQPPFNLVAAMGWLDYAIALEDPDRIEDAIPAFENMVASLGLQMVAARGIYAKGLMHELRGECDKALPFYEEEARLSPTDESVKMQLGRCYHQIGDHGRAIAELKKALLVTPMNPRAHLAMAMVLRDTGDRAGARRHLETALRVWEDADAHYRYAREAREALDILGR